MCYKAPGPRCARTSLARIKAAEYTFARSQESEAHYRAKGQDHIADRFARNAVEATVKLDDARLEFDGTKQGQAALADQIKNATDPNTRTALEVRAQIAKDQREKKKNLLVAIEGALVEEVDRHARETREHDPMAEDLPDEGTTKPSRRKPRPLPAVDPTLPRIEQARGQLETISPDMMSGDQDRAPSYYEQFRLYGDYMLHDSSSGMIVAYHIRQDENGLLMDPRVKDAKGRLARRVGYLSFYPGKYDPQDTHSITGGVIHKVKVSGPQTRKGIATAMLAFAQDQNPESNVRHSDVLSEEGKAWATATPTPAAKPAPTVPPSTVAAAAASKPKLPTAPPVKRTVVPVEERERIQQSAAHAARNMSDAQLRSSADSLADRADAARDAGDTYRESHLHNELVGLMEAANSRDLVNNDGTWR